MQDPDFIALFVEPLEKAGLNYLITGSVASSLYGEPRNTLDIDLVLLLENSQLNILASLFSEDEFYLPPPKVIAIEARREARGHFNIIHHQSGLKADIYLSRNHPYLVWAYENARHVSVSGCLAHFAPPEYVILHKLEFYKESGHQRHLRDIAGMIEQQDLDNDFLYMAMTHMDLTGAYQEVQAFAKK